MPDLSPTETLTAAAQKLREHATADYVTPGPWIVHEANGFLRVDQPGPPSKAWTVKSGADLAEENRGTAEYIALMHPGVGLALADWLQLTADVINSRALADPTDEYTVDISDEHALVVARKILGGES